MILENYRTKLNDSVREWGNKHTPMPQSFIRQTGGIGDFLTAEINARRVGATAGALLPLAFWYKLGSHVGVEGSNTIAKMVFAPILYGTTFYMSIPASMILGKLGYETGKKIDNLSHRANLRFTNFLDKVTGGDFLRT